MPFPISRPPPRPLLCLVEGTFDIACLQHLSAVLHRDDPSLPSLAPLSAQGRLIWIPVDGHLARWADRLSPLGCSQFHLYDRELSPETEARTALVQRLNRDADCRAYLTSRRSLENFLSPAAIAEVTGLTLDFGSDDSVPELLSQRLLVQTPNAPAWSALPRRNRLRRINRAKQLLNHQVASSMTADRLAQSDPASEVRGWLQAIAVLLPPTH